MRKISLTLLLYLCFLSYSFGQWKWLNPQPSGDIGRKVVFTNSQTGFILSDGGRLLKTADQGAHWQIAGDFGKVLCMDIADSTGVMAGSNGLLFVSSDNGNSWSALNSGITDVINLVNIVSRDTFFLASTYNNYYGAIYGTTDRGRTFTKVNAQANTNIGINCMTFINSKLGFVGGAESGILRTMDGGQTWQQMLSSNMIPSAILAIQFLNKDTGYACREYNDVLITHDGGVSWSVANAGQGTNTIAMHDAHVGYAAGEDGYIAKTVDGGATWNSVTAPGQFKDGYGIYSLAFLSVDTGFAVGLLGRILKTTNGGQTWDTYSPTYIPVTAVSFPSADTGYITTWNNVYKTTDSGMTWTMLPLSVGTEYASSSRFEQAQFASADTGFLVSSNYTRVFNTVDGGKTWTQQNPTPYSYDVTRGISFLDQKTGYLSLEETGACCSGMIIRTKDGGKSWKPVWGSQYNGEMFTGIFYIDESTAFAIRNYQVYKTIDSAKTWTLLNLTNDYVNRLTDIWFTDKQTGFVASEEGTIFTTHDAGATWQSQYPLINNYLGNVQINAIRFFNPQVGYITGGDNSGPLNYGFIFKTIDSGRTWQQSSSHGGNLISFTPDSNVLVAGYGGMLMKSPVGTWQIDSVTAQYVDYPCTQRLSASAGVLFGQIDSLSFEVTSPDNKVQYIGASPASVNNGRVVCTAPSDTSWIAGAVYTVRFRLFYKGGWIYSAPTTFTTAGIPKPVITGTPDLLWSSASYGNQWYLNGMPITGAINNGWTPHDTGSYTVQVTQNGCTSLMSDPFRVTGSWKVDGLTVILDSACVERFAAVLQANKVEADSLSFEVAAPDLTITRFPATPNKVNNSTLTVTASTNKLAPDRTYSVKLKLWYNGTFRYSNTITFTPPAFPAPVITESAGQLFSSFAAGNQWYLDGSSISSATDARLVPQRSGNYTVQSTQGACVSPMSQQVRFAAGNLGVVGYPNPVGNQLTLLNTQNRTLSVEIVDMNGSTLYKAKVEVYSTTIPTRQLARGQYVVHLVDMVTGEKKSFAFVRL